MLKFIPIFNKRPTSPFGLLHHLSLILIICVCCFQPRLELTIVLSVVIFLAYALPVVVDRLKGSRQK